MPRKKAKGKKVVIRVRVVPIESVYSVIRRSLQKLDAAVSQYQKKTIRKAAVDRAYDDFTEAMRKLGLRGK
jgi:hypothetical protein